MADVSVGKDFLTLLIEWEIKVGASEVGSGEKISEAVRVATVMDHAPDAVKSMFQLSPLEQRRSVDALKLWTRESTYATPGLFQGSMPMQVGAVSDDGKGKKGTSKYIGDKGKGKDKGKDKNKHKGSDSDRSKERDEWSNGQRQVKFQGYCSWGHKRADCRASLAQQKSGAVPGVREPEVEAEGVKAAQWSDVDIKDVDMDSSSWCFAALNSPRGPSGTLLVDSGADDHTCHLDFAKEFPLKKCAGVTLRDAQGNPLSHHGTRHVKLKVGTRGQRANIDFQIADISDNILSLGNFLRNGFVFNLRGENDLIMYHHRDPTTTVPLFLHKNRLRMRAKPMVYHVSPVMEDDMPVRLSSQSPLRLLDRRKEELTLPKHGTKLDKWARIKMRENELMRGRKSQAAIDSERELGPEGRRREAAIPISDPREPTITEREVHGLTHLPQQPWCEQCIRGRGTEHPHKRVTLERAEHTLPVIAFDFCFFKTSGIVPGMTADEGVTCLVLLDVDTGYM